MHGWYLPEYSWSVFQPHGTTDFCLCARRPGDVLASEETHKKSILEWADANRKRYASIVSSTANQKEVW
jgi:hypothetical protein